MSGIMIFWLVLVIVFALIELATIQLVAIWLSVGGVLALLAASFSLPVPAQFAVFIVVSGVLLVLTRPLVRRFVRQKKVRTNADRNIGTVAKVTQDIDNTAGTGAANISGVPWTARSADGSVIRAGEQVRVERIEGVRLIVTPIRSRPEDAVRASGNEEK